MQEEEKHILQNVQCDTFYEAADTMNRKYENTYRNILLFTFFFACTSN